MTIWPRAMRRGRSGRARRQKQMEDAGLPTVLARLSTEDTAEIGGADLLVSQTRDDVTPDCAAMPFSSAITSLPSSPVPFPMATSPDTVSRLLADVLKNDVVGPVRGIIGAVDEVEGS